MATFLKLKLNKHNMAATNPLVVQIPIPEFVTKTLTEIGFNEQQIPSIFLKFFDEVFNDSYNHTAQAFDEWVESDDFEDITNEIKN